MTGKIQKNPVAQIDSGLGIIDWNFVPFGVGFCLSEHVNPRIPVRKNAGFSNNLHIPNLTV